MNIAIWIIQGILGLVFIMAGIMKSTQPIEKLGKKMPWVNEYSVGMVRFIGIAELLGAIGLIVPQATGIMPFLTSMAAGLLALVMMLASMHHLRRSEFKEVGFNAILFILLVVVTYYRIKEKS